MITANSSHISVRQATAGDLPALIALNLHAVEELSANPPAGFHGDPAAAPDAAQLESEFQAVIEGDGRLLLVAELDGGLAGSVLGTIEDYSDELVEAPYLTVQYVAVAPAMRGSGVGSALLTSLEQAARGLGISVLELRVWANNRSAIDLYIRQGYATLEHRMAKRLR